LFGLQTVNVNKWERVNVRSALVKELQAVCYDVYNVHNIIEWG